MKIFFIELNVAIIFSQNHKPELKNDERTLITIGKISTFYLGGLNFFFKL